MSTSGYLGIAAGAFLVCCAVHYHGWRRFAGNALTDPDPAVRTLALKRWMVFAVAWNVIVIALAAGWIFGFRASRHPHGIVWVAPALAALIGTAAPLQLAVVAISRSGRA